MDRQAAYDRFSTMAVEPGEDGLWTVSSADGEAIAFWVPTKQDAMAIKFGLQMYAEVIKEELAKERTAEQLAEMIMKQSVRFQEQMKDYDGPSH